MAQGEFTAGDALGILGDETRAEILGSLLAAGVGRRGADGLSVAALRERLARGDAVDLDYHLDQLARQFLAPAESGYGFTYPGLKLVRAVQAGLPAADPAFETAGIDGACPHCEARALEAGYESARLVVRCGACQRPLTVNTFPPGGMADRTVTEVLDAYDTLVRNRVSTAVDGVCAECAGRMDGTPTTDVPDGWDYAALAAFECRRCGFWVAPSFGLCLLAHPDAVAFLREHRDAGVVERRFWELPLCVSDEHTTVESRDPWRATVTVPGEDERLVATYEGVDLASLTVRPA